MARKPNYAQWDNKKRARAYAKAHGYYGGDGGWIYKEGREPIIRYTREGVANFKRSRFGGRPVCQGWDNFYILHRRGIEAYIKGLDV